MPQAVDSFSPHTDRSCQALAAAGIHGALRYQYNTSRVEVDRLHRYGLSFALIFERNGNAAVVSPELGADHGRAAVAFAQSIGLPAGCAIWFAEADTHIGRENYDRARRYWALAGAPTRAAGYRVGAYGGSLLIDDLHDRGIADLTWETGAMSWNEWVHSRTCALRQLVGYHDFGGVQTDLNDVVRPDWGQWTPTGAHTPTTPPPSTTIPDQEVDMTTLAEVQQELVNQDTRTRAYIDRALADKDERDKAFTAALIAKAIKAIAGDDALERFRAELG